MPNLTPYQKLIAGRLFAARRMPYFSSAMYLLIPRECHTLPPGSSMGVTEKGFLLWNPEEVGNRTVEQVGTTYLHEVSHWIRGHLARGRVVGAYPGDVHHLTAEQAHQAMLWNFAGDAEINDDLKAVAGLSPMEQWVYPRTLQAPDHLTAEEYYAYARKLPKPPPSSGSDGCGKCGSAAGCAVDGEPDEAGSGAKQPQGTDGKKEEKEGGSDEDAEGQAVDDGEPSDDPGRSPREVAAMRRQVADEIRTEASRGRGTVPAGLLRWAQAVFEPPKVSWQQKLAKCIRSAVSYRAGMVDYRYERPSRRQAALGQGIVLPALRAPIPEVAVAVDTSGSMGAEEIEASLRETVGVLKAVGAPVSFLACDAEVHAAAKVRSMTDLLKHVKGGGGTSFQPVFNALGRMRPRPTVLVYCTDSYGDWEQCSQPPGTSVVWVVTGAPDREAPFGETVHID